MCEIWGFVGGNKTLPAKDGWTGLCALTNRGPDDWVYTDRHGKITSEEPPDEEVSVYWGNRRLSILDLWPAGNQPMQVDDRYWIVYNGEVYNYVELREELRERGHTFDSDCDTEVILHAYIEWGANCVERLRGMFAFAIWLDEECSDIIDEALLLQRPTIMPFDFPVQGMTVVRPLIRVYSIDRGCEQSSYSLPIVGPGNHDE